MSVQVRSSGGESFLACRFVVENITNISSFRSPSEAVSDTFGVIESKGTRSVVVNSLLVPIPSTKF